MDWEEWMIAYKSLESDLIAVKEYKEGETYA